MNAQAALLYRFDAAWQSPRVAEPNKPAAEDVPPVAVPDLENHPVVKLGKLAYGLGGALAVLLTVTIGGYFHINSRLDRQDAKIEAITNWLKDPKTFPGAKGLSVPDDDPQSQVPMTVPAPPGSAAPVLPPASAVTMLVSANPPPAPAPGPRAFPSSIPATSPPECVSSKVFKKMPCERAAPNTCRGLPSFAPERYREIRLQAGVGDYMLVCDEK